MGLSIQQLLIVLVIVLLIFGTKKLKNIGQDLGGAIRGFKEGMKHDEGQQETETDAPEAQSTQKIQQSAASRTIDGEAVREEQKIS